MSINDLSKEELLSIVKEAIKDAVEVHPLSPEEVTWVRLAIQAEAERAALRKAIIEKTLTSLIWAALVAAGWFIFDVFSQYFQNK